MKRIVLKINQIQMAISLHFTITQTMGMYKNTIRIMQLVFPLNAWIASEKEKISSRMQTIQRKGHHYLDCIPEDSSCLFCAQSPDPLVIASIFYHILSAKLQASGSQFSYYI